MNLNDDRYVHGQVFVEPLGPLLIRLNDVKYYRQRPLTPIDNLPDELLLSVFSYLDVGDIVAASSVSHRWFDFSLIKIIRIY